MDNIQRFLAALRALKEQITEAIEDIITDEAEENQEIPQQAVEAEGEENLLAEELSEVDEESGGDEDFDSDDEDRIERGILLYPNGDRYRDQYINRIPVDLQVDDLGEANLSACNSRKRRKLRKRTTRASQAERRVRFRNKSEAKQRTRSRSPIVKKRFTPGP